MNRILFVPAEFLGALANQSCSAAHEIPTRCNCTSSEILNTHRNNANDRRVSDYSSSSVTLTLQLAV